MVLDDQTVTIEQGISSYGHSPFPGVELNDDEFIESRLTADGSHTVDDREGEASRTCVS
jgi:hypothetical protein